MAHRDTEGEGEGIIRRDVIEQRLLVSNEESSIIIGRKGSNVERVRSESEALVTILRSTVHPNTSDRVMVIKGNPVQIAAAISVIARILVENSRATANPTTGAAEITVKFLLHKFLAGCIIGQGGNIMKEIQASTNVRISVSTEALGGSTEKACSVTGTPECLYAASMRIIDQLVSNPLRPGCSTVLFVPGQVVAAGPRSSHGLCGEFYPISHPQDSYYPNYVDPAGYRGNSYPDAEPLRIAPLYQGVNHDTQNPGYPPRKSLYRVEPVFQKPMALRLGVQRIVPLASMAPPAGPPVATEKIVIPKSASGAVIGKGGTIISSIKSQSGTQISLADAAASSEDRVVSITGPPQAIQNAIFLIRQRVEAQTGFMEGGLT